MSGPVASTVTFSRPFLLPGMDKPHAAGTFDVLTEQHELDVWWPAYKLTMTIMLPYGAAMEAWPVNRADLDGALAADRMSAAS
jgi:hypothetical protein